MVNMTPPQQFQLIYAPITKAHLKTIERKYYPLIRATLEAELRFEPDVETRNRKPLRRSVSFEAEWELRFGPANRFRAFYKIDIQALQVHILAIGVKEGNHLFVGGQEVKL